LLTGGASKTVPFSIDRLYAAFADSELRRSRLPDLEHGAVAPGGLG
jgi:hypothetical protein